MRFLTVGSVAIDAIETPYERRELVIGGSANYSAAAAVHFLKPLMVGVVGDDYPPAWFDRLARAGIDTTGVTRVEGKSFFWHGRYGEGFRTRTSIETRLGVFETFRPSLPAEFRNAEFVFLANIGPHVQRMVLEQLTSPLFVAMDTMECWIEGMREEVIELIRSVDCLLVNDEEIAHLTGTSSPFAGLKEMGKMGVRVVVVKMGERGSLLLREGEIFWTPPFPVERIVDPTGAGDCFAGAFLGCLATYGWKTQRDFKRASLYAAAVASFAVESFGPEAILNLTRYQITDRYCFLRNLINF